MLFKWAVLWGAQHPELDLLYAIPNGANKSIATAMKFKREGLKAGVPDVHLPVARQGFHSLYVEMKRAKGGSLSPEQVEWHRRLGDAGHKVVVAKGFDEARLAIESYLDLDRRAS